MQAAAAVEEVIQSDTAIQEEREKLRQLEEQWQNKLSQAEIEISLERAKLARERAELDERLRDGGTRRRRRRPADPSAPETPQPTRGRWLSRLGVDRCRPRTRQDTVDAHSSRL